VRYGYRRNGRSNSGDGDITTEFVNKVIRSNSESKNQLDILYGRAMEPGEFPGRENTNGDDRKR